MPCWAEGIGDRCAGHGGGDRGRQFGLGAVTRVAVGQVHGGRLVGSRWSISSDLVDASSGSSPVGSADRDVGRARQPGVTAARRGGDGRAARIRPQPRPAAHRPAGRRRTVRPGSPPPQAGAAGRRIAGAAIAGSTARGRRGRRRWGRCDAAGRRRRVGRAADRRHSRSRASDRATGSRPESHGGGSPVVRACGSAAFGGCGSGRRGVRIRLPLRSSGCGRREAYSDARAAARDALEVASRPAVSTTVADVAQLADEEALESARPAGVSRSVAGGTAASISRCSRRERSPPGGIGGVRVEHRGDDLQIHLCGRRILLGQSGFARRGSRRRRRPRRSRRRRSGGPARPARNDSGCAATILVRTASQRGGCAHGAARRGEVVAGQPAHPGVGGRRSPRGHGLSRRADLGNSPPDGLSCR